jgi:hypothetical protein
MRVRYALIIEDYPPRLRENMAPPAPATIRLRQLLKQLRRLHGFRVVDARELATGDPPPADGHADGSGGVGDN